MPRIAWLKGPDQEAIKQVTGYSKRSTLLKLASFPRILHLFAMFSWRAYEFCYQSVATGTQESLQLHSTELAKLTESPT